MTERIRPMQPADIEPVMALARSLAHAPVWPRAVYESALDRTAAPPRIALVAEAADTRILGFAVTVLVPPQSELETIAVAATAQRQGIAGRLLAEMMAQLKENEITEVTLEVRESNHPARGLYRAAGFSETGRRTAYYSDPKEDAILLRRAVE